MNGPLAFGLAFVGCAVVVAFPGWVSTLLGVLG